MFAFAQYLELGSSIRVEALYLGHGSSRNDPGLVCHLLDKKLVMAHTNHGTLKGLNALGQCGDGLQIEIVGRFVQNQHVGASKGDGGECHSGSLATGQCRGGRVLQIKNLGSAAGGVGRARGHTTAGEMSPQCLHMLVASIPGEFRPQKLERCHGQINLIGVVLVDQGKAGVGVANDLSFGSFQHARNELDERRLSISIFSQQDDSRFRSDSKLAIAKQTFWCGSRVSKANVFELNNITVNFTACRNLERSGTMSNKQRRKRAKQEVLKIG